MNFNDEHNQRSQNGQNDVNGQNTTEYQVGNGQGYQPENQFDHQMPYVHSNNVFDSHNSRENASHNSYMPMAEPVMSFGQWMATIFLGSLPIINIICLLIWSSGNRKGMENRKNYIKAQLIITVILIIVFMIKF